MHGAGSRFLLRSSPESPSAAQINSKDAQLCVSITAQNNSKDAPSCVFLPLQPVHLAQADAHFQIAAAARCATRFVGNLLINRVGVGDIARQSRRFKVDA